jgi:hypothetical protein
MKVWGQDVISHPAGGWEERGKMEYRAERRDQGQSTCRWLMCPGFQGLPEAQLPAVRKVPEICPGRFHLFSLHYLKSISVTATKIFELTKSLTELREVK